MKDERAIPKFTQYCFVDVSQYLGQDISILFESEFLQVLNNTVNMMSGLVIRQEGSSLISRKSTVCTWAISSCLALMNLKSNIGQGKSLVLRGVEGSLYLSCLPGLHQKHLNYLSWNFSIKQSWKYDLLCALLRREWGTGRSQKITQWMDLGSDFGFESSVCTFKVLVCLWAGWMCLSDAGSLLNIHMGKHMTGLSH